METTTEKKQMYPWGQICWESESEDEVCKEVGALLEKGGSVNQGNMLGETPIFYAVKNRHSKVIKMLLEHGADVEKRNAWGETPLMKAAFLGTQKTIEELVKAGANIEARSADGKTALMMAAGCETDNVKKLLELGAEVNSYDRFSMS
ncbi:MAG: ankyrin repeat domain-containing protein, partial [Alphaproteobacteria bacterium]|nr:ankyrin repeat domain-containing protein [Alphaproteobacteria bacterium]